MFGLIESLAKAAVAVVVTPVALVADIVSLPASAESNEHPFKNTGKALSAVEKNLTDAVK
jgi:hypothetical protein